MQELVLVVDSGWGVVSERKESVQRVVLSGGSVRTLKERCKYFRIAAVVKWKSDFLLYY